MFLAKIFTIGYAISGFIYVSRYKIYDQHMNITIDHKWVDGVIGTSFYEIRYSIINSKKILLFRISCMPRACSRVLYAMNPSLDK